MAHRVDRNVNFNIYIQPMKITDDALLPQNPNTCNNADKPTPAYNPETNRTQYSRNKTNDTVYGDELK